MAKKYIYTTKYVHTPEEYLQAIKDGYCVIEIPSDQIDALLVILEKNKYESDDILYEYGNRLSFGGHLEEKENIFNILAKRNNPRGIFGLGVIAEDDFFDLDAIEKYYRQAAEMGYAPAQYFLASFLDFKNEGLDWLLKAADAGLAEAQYYAAIHYYKPDLSEHRDLSKAFYWFKRAADQDFDMAQHYTGLMYFNGEHVEQSYEEAFNWFMKAYLNDFCHNGMMHSNYYIGVMYYHGYYVKQSYELAYEYFIAREKFLWPKESYYLGLMYFYGHHVEKSYENAVKYFDYACRKNDDKAQVFLGMMYYSGTGVSQSYIKAYGYWKEAAKHDNADAEYYLALLYLKGQGVEKSKDYAIKLLNEASQNGHQEAKQLLNKIKK